MENGEYSILTIADYKGKLDCDSFGNYCDFRHYSLALLVYNPNKESNKSELIKFIFDKKNNNCKAVKEINKRLRRIWLWKHISVFLGCLALFTSVCLLFWLLNSDNEDYRNKKRIKRLGTVNGGRSRSKNRDINKNGNIKKRIRMSRRKFVSKKKRGGGK